MKVSQLGEFGLIRSLKRQIPYDNSVKIGIGDDAAVVRVNAKKDGLLTTDMLVEGVHFKKKDNPKDIGRKAISASLSDIAAMGGRPLYALVSLGLGPSQTLARVKEIYKGLIERARQFDTVIIGGDVVRAKNLIINVAVYGEAKSGDAFTRSGARPGDLIYVTGTLGASLKSGHHLTFSPRLKAARALRKYHPSSMIDISDGLLADLGHILKMSSVGARLNAENIPRRPGASLDNALYDGEDFELLFTVPKTQARLLDKQKGLRVYRIGEIVRDKKLTIFKAGKIMKTKGRRGYTHF